MALEKRITALEKRVDHIEGDYVSHDEVRDVVHSEIGILNTTLEGMHETLKELVEDVKPWRERQKAWVGLLFVAKGWRGFAGWLAATIGVVIAVMAALNEVGVW